jgi:PadR family transcriptional regulator, regulatory protein PadR
MRLTHALVQVALVLMDDPFGRYWGYDLSKHAHVRSGVLYPMLTRMLADGWLSDGWEDETKAVKRPPRRYYELTGKGRSELADVLTAAQADGRFVGVLGWAVT